MPLLDHFHPPLSRTHPWRGFHGAWAAAIARLLNDDVLPSGYYAVPFLDREGPVEIDVATLRADGGDAPLGLDGSSPWSPASPALSVAVDLTAVDDVRVEVMTNDGDPRLAAAIELVSPPNKDRPQARQAFAAECADHLRRGCGAVVVDAVTTRRADLHADLLAAFGAAAADAATDGPASAVMPPGISAVSYQAVGHGVAGRLLAWPAALEVGRPLPTVPLWLAADLAVPLDLEATHAAAYADLRIRRAG